LKNRGLKVEINHVSIPLGGKVTNSSINIADNFPDSSIGEGMDITIQGANGHVKHNTADNQSLKSLHNEDTRNTDDKLNNKYSDMSIGLGMDISIRGDGDATTNKEAATPDHENNGWPGVSRHSSLNFDTEKEANGDAVGEDLKNMVMEDDILSQTEIKHVEEVLCDPVDDVVVEECCPEVCYRVCPCCIGDPDSPFWQLWYRHRLQVSRYVLILLSTIRGRVCIHGELLLF